MLAWDGMQQRPGPKANHIASIVGLRRPKVWYLPWGVRPSGGHPRSRCGVGEIAAAGRFSLQGVIFLVVACVYSDDRLGGDGHG